MNIYIYVDDIREDDNFFKHLLRYTQMEWNAIICRSAEEAIFFLNYYNNNSHNVIIDLDHDLGEGHEIDDSLAPSG